MHLRNWKEMVSLSNVHCKTSGYSYNLLKRLQLQGFIQGGGREGTSPPPSKIPPPPLNQHKYYKKMVLKHKQQQSDSCCSKKVCTCSRIFPKVYSSCQNIGNRHCFLGARWFLPPPPPLFEKSCMNSEGWFHCGAIHGQPFGQGYNRQ